MSGYDERITDQMRDRIHALLVAEGAAEGAALREANSLSDGLGYYRRVTASTGMQFQRGFDGIEVVGPDGTVRETIPFERLPGWE